MNSSKGAERQRVSVSSGNVCIMDLSVQPSFLRGLQRIPIYRVALVVGARAVTDLKNHCCLLRLGALGQLDLEVTWALPAWLGAGIPGPGRRAAALRVAESASGALVQATPGYPGLTGAKRHCARRVVRGCRGQGCHPIRMFQNQAQALFPPSCVTRHQALSKLPVVDSEHLEFALFLAFLSSHTPKRVGTITGAHLCSSKTNA